MKKIFTLISVVLCAMSVNAQGTINWDEAEKWAAFSLKDPNASANKVIESAIIVSDNNVEGVVVHDESDVLPYPGAGKETDPTTITNTSDKKLKDYVISANSGHVIMKAVGTPNLGETESWAFQLSIQQTSTIETETNNRCLNADDCHPKFIDYIKVKSGNPDLNYIDWWEYNSDGDPSHKVYGKPWTLSETSLPVKGAYYEFTPTETGKLRIAVYIANNLQTRPVYFLKETGVDRGYTVYDKNNVSVEGYLNNKTFTWEEALYQEFYFDDNYILHQKSSKTAETEGTIVPTNRPFLGYFTLDVEANVTYMMMSPQYQIGMYGFAFIAGGASGVNTIKAAEQNANAPIYNLAGQQVDKSYKGVVIQNGTKRIQK